MINVNDFDKGYQDGLNDAINGKKKEYGGMISIKSFFFGDITMDTYIKGYDKGYLDGLRKRNNIYETNSKTILKSTNMAVHQYEQQHEILGNMFTFLEKFNESVNTMIAEYHQYLEMLESEGFDVKYVERFTDKYEETKKMLLDIVSKIEDDDMKYNKDRTLDVEELMSRQ